MGICVQIGYVLIISNIHKWILVMHATSFSYIDKYVSKNHNCITVVWYKLWVDTCYACNKFVPICTSI